MFPALERCARETGFTFHHSEAGRIIIHVYLFQTMPCYQQQMLLQYDHRKVYKVCYYLNLSKGEITEAAMNC